MCVFFHQDEVAHTVTESRVLQNTRHPFLTVSFQQLSVCLTLFSKINRFYSLIVMYLKLWNISHFLFSLSFTDTKICISNTWPAMLCDGVCKWWRSKLLLFKLVSGVFVYLCMTLDVSSFLLFKLFWELQWLISFSHWHRLDQWNLGSECNPFGPVWKQQHFHFKTMSITNLVNCQYLCLMRMSRLRRINLHILQKCCEMRTWRL